MAQYADLSSDLDSHDLVYGVVLPNLQEKYDSVTKKKEEYTHAQARSVDFTSLPLRMNHGRQLHQVGVTMAYRVRDATKTGDQPRAEAVFKLNREPEHAEQDSLSRICALQRNLLMEGAHRGLSLGHTFNTDYVGNCGTYAASIDGGSTEPASNDPYGDPGRVLHKNAEEISLVARGLRDGSHILEYLPCKRSLHRSADDAVRQFVTLYNYTAPDSALSRNHPGWRSYIDTLATEVRERRDRVLTQNGYGSLLRGRGEHMASSDAEKVELLQEIPWIFLPHLESKGIARFNAFNDVMNDVARDEA